MASCNHERLFDDATNDSSLGSSAVEEQTSVTERSDQSKPESHCPAEAVIKDEDIAISEANTTCSTSSTSTEQYGIGSWHPSCLQWMVSPAVFVTLLCFFTASDAFFSGIQVAVLTTLETRYGLSGYQIGMVVTINKIGTMLGLPIAAYLGGRPSTHRPRWIAGSAFVMAAGMMATCIPQFIFGPYQYHQIPPGVGGSPAEEFDLCSAYKNRSMSTNEECSQTTSRENEAAYIIILISQFVVGVGYAPTRPLGISYIDDNVQPNKAGFYIGIVSSMYGLLVVFGFLASSATALVWVDFYRTETTLTQADHAWVSAWWLLFLFIAFLLMLSGIPFLGFPKRLPWQWKGDVDESAGNSCRESVADGDNDERPDDSRSSEGLIKTLKLSGVKEVFRSLKRICMNGSYIMASMAFTITGLITGLLSFFPKYMESQFGLTTSLVNILVATVIPALAIGSILGGYLCRRWNLQIIGQTKLCLACVCIADAFALLLFAFGCQNQPVANINDSITGNSVGFANLTSPCNRDCDCGMDVFQPVCWEAGQITYISPCLAGCSSSSEMGTLDTKQFMNCTCLHDDATSSGDLAILSHGACGYQCATLVPFLICSFVFVLFFSIESAPLILTVVRSVESRDKSFAYGITKCLQYVIGVIPTPVITGALIDTTCKLWQYECGQRGACWIHDLPGFRYIMGGSGSLVLALQVVLLALCLFFLKKRLKYTTLIPDEGDDNRPPRRGEVELDLRDS